MGRADAVQFTLEWAAEARRLGAIVDFEAGWETRGNGTTANYEGGIVHHTAFLSSATNQFPAKQTLKLGRSDLPGPLCNVAGPWCEDGTPRLVVIAAHPANHAGASGGKSMGPLPVTSLFNPRVFGLEIDYGGLVPMTKGQRKAATIFGRALCNVVGRSSEYVRAHAETSITGKWDIGVGDGQAHTDDMGAFRRGITNFADSQEDDMFSDADRKLLTDIAAKQGSGTAFWLDAEVPPNSKGELSKRIRATDIAVAEILAIVRSGADIDEAQIAAALAPMLGEQLVAHVVAELSSELDLPLEQVQAATERGVRAVLGSLDANPAA